MDNNENNNLTISLSKNEQIIDSSPTTSTYEPTSIPSQFSQYRDIEVQSIYSKKSEKNPLLDDTDDEEDNNNAYTTIRKKQDPSDFEDSSSNGSLSDNKMENWPDLDNEEYSDSNEESSSPQNNQNIETNNNNEISEQQQQSNPQSTSLNTPNPSLSLSRTVRSYLNVLNSSNNTNAETTSISIAAQTHRETDYVTRSLNFEPKNKKEFEKLLEKVRNKKDDKKNDVQIKDSTDLLKLAELFSTCENYYTTMMSKTDGVDFFSNKTDFTKLKSNIEECSGIEQIANKRMRHTSGNNFSFSDEEKNNEIQEKIEENQNEDDCNNEIINNITSDDGNCDFHLCKLCSHCLCEPITLVCGCSFCKNCLYEYNKMLQDISMNKSNSNLTNIEANEKEENIEQDQKSKFELNECFSCHKAHLENSTESIRPNVALNNLVAKFWSKNILVRSLRNDLRSYVCFHVKSMNIFDFGEYETMFIESYLQDPSNHLILADLLLLNYFYSCDSNCLKYADMIQELKPTWPFSYYLKSIYYEKLGDLNQCKNNLIICLQIDSDLKYLQSKLVYMNEKLLSNNNSNNNSNENLSLIEKIHHPRKRSYTIHKLQHLNKSSSLGEIRSVMKDSSSQLNEFLTRIRQESNNIQIENQSESSKTVAEQEKKITGSITNFDSDKCVSIHPILVKVADLECSLCYRLLFKPVTTPCGHTFCCSCLDRSLDHQDTCPLCKYSLAEYLAERRQNVTLFIEKLIKIHYPVDFKEREKQHEEEIQEIASPYEVPIFVCTLGLPYVPCPLHVYEPRYRLMIRRAIESGHSQFGMCSYTESTSWRYAEYAEYAEYGCLLKIRTSQFTMDGRAIVDTVGARRFKVIDDKMKDGYHVATVEWIKDEIVEDEGEKAQLKLLHDEVYRLGHIWVNSLSSERKEMLFSMHDVNSYPEPDQDIQSNENGPYWFWFLLTSVPLDNSHQYKFLSKTSLYERLNKMKNLLLILQRIKQMENCSSSSNTSLNSTTSSVAPHETTATRSSDLRVQSDQSNSSE